ncbi:MAG: hypothetical protein JRF38_14730 [Deltaproteobacteria bacterium]|nr:hypothetical protein [Deltaproteobacteria bacterium]
MAERPSGIRYLPGKRDLLVISPHSPVIDGVFENDARTGIIAEHVQNALDCHAIINDLFFKPKGPIKKSFENYFLDLYRLDHSTKVSGYLSRIETIVKAGAKTHVLWVHGITDDVAVAQGQEHRSLGLFDQAPERLQALIGYGQGGDPKTGETESRYTARQKTVETFRDHLCAAGLTTLLTHPEGSNYRGRDAKRLNQWFNQLGYGFDRVESMHLELREKGVRDTEANAVKTAGVIAKALSLLMQTGSGPG